MGKLCRYFNFLIKAEKGNVLILVALLIVVLFGFAALVIDVGQLYLVKRQMVSAADGAALAGAMENYDQNTNKENRARSIAKDYAEYNGAENFSTADDVKFTPPSGDNRTMHVRASKLVEFTFARLLGFDNSLVSAVASVRLGPGNSLVPFVKIGYPCTCPIVDECECESDDDCTCVFECECESYGYVIRHEDGTCVKPGETVQLKYSDWKDSELSAGNFGYVRLPGQKGGNDLRNDIGGGYSGTLESLKACQTEIQEEGGQKQGPLVQGLSERLRFANDPPCTTYAAVKDDPYICPLVVIAPLVHTKHEIDPNYPTLKNKWVKIVGYASFLLILGDAEGVSDDDKEVHAILIEYLNWDRIQEILPENLEGYVLKLVRTVGNPF